MTESEWDAILLPTFAAGREFTHVPEHVRADLYSLEFERAIYGDQWVEEVEGFRHVRIAFTDEEREDYVRRSWAYELWLRAGSPNWARDTPGIDQGVAHDADSYVMETSDGRSFGPPYHCFAAFLGEHLEALTCGMLPERRRVIELAGREALLYEVRRAIESLTPTIRSFNARERGLKPWPIEREDDVRDLLYVMLRPLVFDLAKEEPVPSRAGTYKLVDLYSRSVKLFIEVKWVAKPGQWKRIVEQIHVDTQSYIAHPACELLTFVIVDASRSIPDPRRLELELSGKQSIGGKSIQINVFVAEP